MRKSVKIHKTRLKLLNENMITIWIFMMLRSPNLKFLEKYRGREGNPFDV